MSAEKTHEEWLDELVPPVEGGPRLTPAQQRERVSAMLAAARGRPFAVETCLVGYRLTEYVAGELLVEHIDRGAKTLRVVGWAKTSEDAIALAVQDASPSTPAAPPALGGPSTSDPCPGCGKPIRDEVYTEDDETAGLLAWHRACFEADAAPAPPDVLHDLLLLVMDGAHPTVETIEAWTEEQRVEAERWAAHEHLIASDHRDVERLSRPAFLVAPRPQPDEFDPQDRIPWPGVLDVDR